jgi:hypothetical protein
MVTGCDHGVADIFNPMDVAMSVDPNPPKPPPGAIQPVGTSPVASSNAIASGPPPGAAPEFVGPGGTAAPVKSVAKPSTKTPAHHDSFREFIETIVFVVVLVLILKTFLAEAFVIPTGSMATTLLGYHGEVRCKECNYQFLINKSKEADPAERHHQQVTRCYCPNCFFKNDFQLPVPQGGRR